MEGPAGLAVAGAMRQMEPAGSHLTSRAAVGGRASLVRCWRTWSGGCGTVSCRRLGGRLQQRSE